MPRQILIVDDDRHTCEALQDRLQAMGYDVITAHDGHSAVAMVVLESRRSPIHGVLLDIQMPGMDGMAVLRELRRQHPELPIIMMSAGPKSILIESLHHGARDYIVKPIDMEVLKIKCVRVFNS